MTQPEYFQRIESAKNGKNPAVICRVPSGWVFLANMQFLSGYCILLADPVVDSLNCLDPAGRAQYLQDMSIIGDAILEVTGAYRINYAIMGNSEPVLHAHIVPRYINEPSEYRKGLPWSYPKEVLESKIFDKERDGLLIKRISCAVNKRNNWSFE